MNSSGTGILSYRAQADWLRDYTESQVAWVNASHHRYSKRELETYQAGIVAGWNKLRATLSEKGIVNFEEGTR